MTPATPVARVEVGSFRRDGVEILREVRWTISKGEHWVLLGSWEALPEDLAATPATAGVAVLELQWVSAKAAGVRLQVSAGAGGKLIRVSSATAGSEVYPELYWGQSPPSLTADGNFTPEDFVEGQLQVDGQDFMYGYFPAGESPLAAVRIHNRATGAWHCHEHALEKVMAAGEVPVAVGPSFEEQDETLADTDGDGVPDFADFEEVRSPTPEQLGVELRPQVNVLDLVAVDEAGWASWRTLNVFTTYTPPSE